MNAEVRAIKTPAEQGLSAAYAAARGNLPGDAAVKALREVMGATNPANAAEGTVRKRFAANIERNCIHGSDAPETAAVELAFFFSTAELL